MKVHELKVWPPHWAAIQANCKREEIRPDDRDYRMGDQLTLREWLPERAAYTGLECTRFISHVLPGGEFGLAPGYVALSLSVEQWPPRALA